MIKRRILSVVLCVGLMLTSCADGAVVPDHAKEEFVGMNEEPQLDYEVPESIPHILIDQNGYLPEAEKTVFFRGANLPEHFEIVETETGQVVYEGDIREKEIDSQTGESIGYGSFSEFSDTGTFYVKSATWGRSYDFQIDEQIYMPVYERAMTVFRTRQDKKINVAIPEKAAQGASMGTGTAEKAEVILQGGWYTDRSGSQDMNQAAEAMTALLLAYELYPGAFRSAKDAQDDIELLGLLRQQAEWMLLLQEDKTGGVYAGITKNRSTTGYSLREPDIKASAAYAAAMARFSYVYKNVDQQFASETLRAADRAWKYIIGQVADPTMVLERDLLFAASVELYRASGQYTYQTFVGQFLNTGIDISNSSWATYGGITYLSTRQRVEMEYCEQLMKQLMSQAEQISQQARSGAYQTEGNANLTNIHEVLWNMVVLAVADYVITNHEYGVVIENHQHFLMGCNRRAVCLLDVKSVEQIAPEELITDDLLKNAYYICMLSEILHDK